MSTKFEQLLDYLVNEEMDKANELFHEIVVEKSRDIYEGLIAEEAEDENVDEAEDDENDPVDEGADEDTDESMDLEDSYMMDADDDEEGDEFGGDATDDLEGDIGMDDEGGDDMGGDDMGGEGSAMFDIKNAIAELEAAFAELEASQGGDAGGEFGDDEGGDDFGGDDFADDGEADDEMMGKPAFESRRMTREYVEKVGSDWDKNAQKTQNQIAGANTGEKMPGADAGRSPVSSGKGKPTTGATASNILGSTKAGEGTNVGTSPNGKAGGFVKNPTDMKTGNGNVPGGKMGVKNLSNVAGGHGAEKKSAGPGPVGSGSGDKAGQTNIDPATKRQFLPQHTK
jgi:hypothetical protein